MTTESATEVEKLTEVCRDERQHEALQIIFLSDPPVEAIFLMPLHKAAGTGAVCVACPKAYGFGSRSRHIGSCHREVMRARSHASIRRKFRGEPMSAGTGLACPRSCFGDTLTVEG